MARKKLSLNLRLNITKSFKMKHFLTLLLTLPFFIFSQENTDSDRDAKFPGGIEAMKKYLSKNITYPEISMELGDYGRIFVEFVVNKDGSIEQVKVLRGVSAELDEEALRVVSEMPNWIPAIYKGEITRARCKIPINFELLDDTKNYIYDYPQTSARFPGGNKALGKFINKKLKYPKASIKNRDEGEVIIEFVINIDGSIEQIKVHQSVSKELDEESLRLVSKMPKWIPAKHLKDKVRSRYKLPLNFKL